MDGGGGDEVKETDRSGGRTVEESGGRGCGEEGDGDARGRRKRMAVRE